MAKKVPAGPARGKDVRPSAPPSPAERGFSPLGRALELPRWRARGGTPPPSPAELLLIAVAGERGEASHDDPIEATAVRLADELQALADSLDGDDGTSPIGVVIGYHAARARALAELIGVTRMGSAA